MNKCHIDLHCLMPACLRVTSVWCCRVFHMMIRRRELSKAAEGVVGCADNGSGHVPHDCGAAVTAANLKMAAAYNGGSMMAWRRRG